MLKSVLFLLILITTFSTYANSPLAPIKVDHPRDTMTSYLNAMNDYKKGLKNDDPHLLARIDDAVRTFNLENIPFLLRKEKGRTVAKQLMEIIDRVIIIDLSKIPEDNKLKRWRLKDTEIIITPVTEGERQGEFLFSASTVERMEQFYDRVKHLPYLPGSGHGVKFKEPLRERFIPSWGKSQLLGLANWQWIGILLSIFLGLFIKKITEIIVSFSKKVTQKNETSKRHKFIIAIEQPVGLIVATAFWFACIHILAFEGKALAFLLMIVQVLLSAALVWMCYRLTDVLTEYMAQLAEKTESELDDLLVPMLSKSLRIFVIVVGVLVSIQNLGFNVMSLLAGLGLGGLAFALAAKDTAANLFGSIMILIDRPFKPGDWIITSSAEGTVEEIGFRSTRVRTFYNSVIYIPNSLLASQNIDNMGVRQYRRIKTMLGLTYNTPPEKIEAFVEGLKQIIKANPHTRKDYFHVALNNYGKSSLEILLYCFLEVNDWSIELVEKQNLFLEILRLAQKLKIDFAFPTQSIHIESTPEKPLNAQEVSPNEDLLAAVQTFGPNGMNSKPSGLGIFTPTYRE